MENQQVELVKQQAVKARDIVSELIIENKEGYENAVKIGTRIKEVSKAITERKEEITKPLNEALKSARALFKQAEDTLGEAETNLKTKMLAWREIERKLEEEARKKADEEIKRQEELLKKNEVSQMEATKNQITAMTEANQAKVEKTIKTDTGAKATEKFVSEWVVVDKSLIPLVFMEPNMVAIKQAFKDGQPVPGVEERKKAIISF